MNLTATNSGTLKLVKQHSIAAFGGLCLALTVAAGVIVALAPSNGGTTATVAPRASYDSARPVHSDWRTIYYIVPTQEMGDQILRAEAEQQNVILESNGVLPSRTIQVIVVDSPAQDELLAQMMGDALADTTSFVDTRYPPIPAINSDEPALSQVAPVVEADSLPLQDAVVQLHQPYPCSEASIDVSVVEQLAGLCN